MPAGRTIVLAFGMGLALMSCGSEQSLPDAPAQPAAAIDSATWAATDATGQTEHVATESGVPPLISGSGGMAAPLEVDGWTGLAAVGPFETAITGEWPSQDLHWTWWGWLLPRAYSTGEWSEQGLATIDQQDDYLEPAFVTSPGLDIRLGLDYLVEGIDQEQTVRTIDPISDPYGYHRVDIKRTAATGEVTFELDGVVLASASDTGDSPPGRLTRPPAGEPLVVGLGAMATSRAVLRDGLDGNVLYDFHPEVDGTDGALAVSSAGARWTSIGGRVLAPLDEQVFYGAKGSDSFPQQMLEDESLLDIEEQDSFTWSITWLPTGPPPGSSITTWWGRNFSGLQNNEAGYGIGDLSMLGPYPPFAFLIGDGSEQDPIVLDLGDRPITESTLVVRLDRSTETIDAWIDGVEVASASIDSLEAVAPSAPFRLDGYYFTDELSLVRRALSDEEIREISPP